MDLHGLRVAITGGSSGIGYSLTKAFMARKCTLIICGRTAQKLDEVVKSYPEVHTRICDVADADSREQFVDWVRDRFGGLDILINNAGIQRDVNLSAGMKDLMGPVHEIDINIKGPVYLSALCVPMLRQSENAAIINVSSVLAFVPMTRVPIYCATKAFLHSYSLSLRHQLQPFGIKVFEIMPPRVKTALNSEGRKKMGYSDSGIDPDEFVSAVMTGLGNDQYEIEYEKGGTIKDASRAELNKMFVSINNQSYNWD